LSARAATLATVLVFIVGLAGLTATATVRDGVTVLTIVSGLVLVLFGCGILGALLDTPED